MYVRLPKPLDEMTPEEIQEFTEDTDKRLAVFYTYTYRYRQKGLEPSINGSTPATETPPVPSLGVGVTKFYAKTTSNGTIF